MYYTEHARGTGEYRRLVAAPILIALLALTAIAWIVTVWNARAGGALMMAGVPMSLAMPGRLSLASGTLFLSLWAVMMAAMMFPSVWPTVLSYAAGMRNRDAQGGSVLSSSHSSRAGSHGPQSGNPADVEAATQDGGGEVAIGRSHGFTWGRSLLGMLLPRWI